MVSQKLIIAPAIYGPGRTQGLPHSIRFFETQRMSLSTPYAESPSWAGYSFSNNNCYVVRSSFKVQLNRVHQVMCPTCRLQTSASLSLPRGRRCDAGFPRH